MGSRHRIVPSAIALLCTTLLCPPATAGRLPGLDYVSPVPGARYVSPETNLIFRPGGVFDSRLLRPGAITVTGSVSGPHSGVASPADEGRAILFQPDAPFALGETVSVRLEAVGCAKGGRREAPIEYAFTISTLDQTARRSLLRPDPEEGGGGEAAAADAGPERWSAPARSGADGPTALANALPPTFPRITLSLSDRPSPGYVFLAPFIGAGGDSGHLVILDNHGQPILYERVVTPAIDFKRQPDGRLTYFTSSPRGGGPDCFYALDSAYAVVDSFAMGNGYVADEHDLQVLPNGHALLMAYDPQPVRMDSVVAGGDPNATVVGLVVQELDRRKRVVFEWRSWDHFAITDVVSPDVNLTGAYVDYVHGNSVTRDRGGDLVISSRHMSEVTKIDRRTGEIVWRLGLHAKNNQFTFVNDARGFSHQHDALVTPNGHLTLFDNGNRLVPQYSRGVEYVLDERRRTATLVWEYRNTPDTYGGFMGSVKRSKDGGALIGWGGTFAGPRVTEVHADGTKALELTMQPGRWSYRAYKFPWRTTRIVTADSLEFGSAAVGSTASRALRVANRSATSVTINDAFVSDPAFTLLTPLPLAIPPGGETEVEVSFAPSGPGRHEGVLYLKSLTRNELVARDVALGGTGGAVSASLAVMDAPAAFELRSDTPNPATADSRFSFELPAPSPVDLRIFDVRGREVAVLEAGDLPAGHHTRTWNARTVPAGVYFYRLVAGGAAATRKLIVMR